MPSLKGLSWAFAAMPDSRRPVCLAEGEPPARDPYVWSFRSPERSVLARLAAHVLIRLLILSPLPVQFQVAAALFPVSMLWPLIAKQEPAQGGETATRKPLKVSQDPLGNVTTFTRSQYVDKTTGETGIGAGGGTVTAIDGSGLEMRIPEGALDKGVTLKISSFTLDSLPEGERQIPDFGTDTAGNPVAHLGSGLKIESDDKPVFKREVKLAFPVPSFAELPPDARPAKPEDAFYYVFRKLVGPCPDGGDTCNSADRPVVFQTIDQALVEGTGANAKVVTACPPLEGYASSVGAFAFSPAGNFLILAATATAVYLLWTYNRLLPGKALSGVVTGRVLRTQWDPAAVEPSYEGVPGVLVSGADQGGTPLRSGNATVAMSQWDGTYTLIDPRYTGGPVKVAATLGNVTVAASGYEENPADSKTPNLRFYKNIARANLTFPPVQPAPPPPAIDIRVMTNVDGKRKATNGLVVQGTPLLIGFNCTNGDVRGAEIAGVNYSVKEDPLKGLDPLGVEWILDGDVTPGLVGAYTVTATALPAFGPPVRSSSTFRVIAPGGGTKDPVPGPPKVIDAQTVPKANATGVPVTVNPQIVFTEPVLNVPGNVTLAEVTETGLGDPVPLNLAGMSLTGPVAQVTAGDQITSLTLQPLVGLKFGATYRISLTSGIHDLDKDLNGNPDPKDLEPYTTDFTTFEPEGIGGTGTFGSPGIVVMGERAYLVENLFSRGKTRAFKTDDPVTPEEIQPDTKDVNVQTAVVGRPVDLAGENESALTGDKLLVVATSSTNVSKPNNLMLFDVAKEGSQNRWYPYWIGAVSVTSGAVEGSIVRLVVKDGLAYTVTSHKGIQVVDLSRARDNFQTAIGGKNFTTGYWDVVRRLATAGQGFGQDAVTVTVPVKKASGQDWMLWDMDVGAYMLAGQSLPLAVVAGEPGLVVVNTQARTEAEGIVSIGPVDGPTGRLTWGQAVGIGRVGDTAIAVLAGNGVIKDPVLNTEVPGKVLAVVDMTDPAHPQALSFLKLTEIPVDIVLKGSLALLGMESQVVVVNLEEPDHPVIAGTIQGVGGRLALADNNILYSTTRSVFGLFGGEDPLGGVKTAALGVVGAILRPKPTLSKPIAVASGPPQEEETIAEIPVRLRVFPHDSEITQASVEIYNDGALARMTDVAMTAGAGVLWLPERFKRKLDAVTTAVLRFLAVDGAEVRSAPRKLDIGTIILRVDSNNDTIVAAKDTEDDAADEEAAASDKKAFVFWEGDPKLEVANKEDGLVDFATISLRLRTRLDPDQKVALRLANTDWELHSKVTRDDLPGLVPEPPADCVKEGKLHLCNAKAAAFQVNTNSATDPNLVPTPRGGGVIEIPYAALPLYENLFLFRVNPSDDGLPMGPPGVIEAGQVNASGGFDKVSEAKVEIKRFQSLTSMVTLRRSSQPSPDAFGDHYKISPIIREEPGWSPVPPEAKEVTLIVHGFAVPHEEFTSGTGAAPSEFQVKAKRLYWARHPILEAQDHARVVGVSWPGDLPNADPVVRRAASGSRLYYPEDEFNALLGGVPLASYIGGLRSGTGRKIDIFAHSLGNMLVSSALQQLATNKSSGAPINYVMNQAAVASEAYLDQYDPLAAAREGVAGVEDLLTHAQDLGFPNPANGRPDPDFVWLTQETDSIPSLVRTGCPTSEPFAPPEPPPGTVCTSPPIPAPPPLPIECFPQRCVPSTRYYRGQATTNSVLGSFSYSNRWGKSGRNQDQNKTLRGPWTRLFFDLVDPTLATPAGIRVFNTYSWADYVIRIDRPYNEGWPIVGRFFPSNYHAWKTGQIIAKPFGTVGESLDNAALDAIGLGGARDPLEVQKWWTLEIDGRPSTWQTTLFGAGEQNAAWGGGGHEAQARRWAELALWFPALSVPAGADAILSPATSLAQSLTGVNLDGLPSQGRNIDFSSIGGDSGPDSAINGTPSHSYMLVSKFYDVWKGYRVLRGLFKQ